MNKSKIQKELQKIAQANYAKKTDKQLMAYERMHEMHKGKNKGIQSDALKKFNNPIYRECKLTPEMVKEIRQKYVPHVYGKQRIAAEYGVSTSVIYRIIQGKSWKNI